MTEVVAAVVGRSHNGRAGRDECGMADSLSWALLVPLLFVLVLGLVQTGVWLHSRTTVTFAAAAAAEEAARYSVSATGSGQVEAAEAMAERIMARAGLQQAEVTVTVEADTVRVVVSAKAPVFFDVGQSVVQAQAAMPREQVATGV